eukprot:TRINITY_DN8287_c0_g1_i1.p1 TRINITY_DN8287_c0_g1~~TRINITY_DN8287_c0_g1_i1.p1  ORF type:complete len:186 (+),score=52.25 TRINITY_DN8287_c0_g1_i1:56-559(+)
MNNMNNMNLNMNMNMYPGSGAGNQHYNSRNVDRMGAPVEDIQQTFRRLLPNVNISFSEQAAMAWSMQGSPTGTMSPLINPSSPWGPSANMQQQHQQTHQNSRIPNNNPHYPPSAQHMHQAQQALGMASGMPQNSMQSHGIPAHNWNQATTSAATTSATPTTPTTPNP